MENNSYYAENKPAPILTTPEVLEAYNSHVQANLEYHEVAKDYLAKLRWQRKNQVFLWPWELPKFLREQKALQKVFEVAAEKNKTATKAYENIYLNKWTNRY